MGWCFQLGETGAKHRDVQEEQLANMEIIPKSMCLNKDYIVHKFQEGSQLDHE